MLKRVYAIFHARNLEFVRDRGTMAWNLILPVALMFGISFIFSSDRSEFTVGVLQHAGQETHADHPFLQTRYVEFAPVTNQDDGIRKIARHQLDLLVDFSPPARYWINPDAPNGYFAEIALQKAVNDAGGTIEKSQIGGAAVRYVDWVLPGVLGMNMMFSSLFGIGYVIVRYRKNGFLKRLRATPLRAIDFVVAHVASRLLLITAITSFVYAGTAYFLNIRMEGSYLALFLVLIVGATSLISLGLLVAARVTSEELAGGLLNMVTWPMIMLSGVWFSLEAAAPWVQQAGNIFPLTHILSAARLVMLDGAGVEQIAPQLFLLAVMSVIFLSVGALTFRWHPK